MGSTGSRTRRKMVLFQVLNRWRQYRPTLLCLSHSSWEKKREMDEPSEISSWFKPGSVQYMSSHTVEDGCSPATPERAWRTYSSLDVLGGPHRRRPPARPPRPTRGARRRDGSLRAHVPRLVRLARRVSRDARARPSQADAGNGRPHEPRDVWRSFSSSRHFPRPGGDAVRGAGRASEPHPARAGGARRARRPCRPLGFSGDARHEQVLPRIAKSSEGRFCKQREKLRRNSDIGRVRPLFPGKTFQSRAHIGFLARQEGHAASVSAHHHGGETRVLSARAAAKRVPPVAPARSLRSSREEQDLHGDTCPPGESGGDLGGRSTREASGVRAPRLHRGRRAPRVVRRARRCAAVRAPDMDVPAENQVRARGVGAALLLPRRLRR